MCCIEQLYQNGNISRIIVAILGIRLDKSGFLISTRSLSDPFMPPVFDNSSFFCFFTHNSNGSYDSSSHSHYEVVPAACINITIYTCNIAEKYSSLQYSWLSPKFIFCLLFLFNSFLRTRRNLKRKTAKGGRRRRITLNKMLWWPDLRRCPTRLGQLISLVVPLTLFTSMRMGHAVLSRSVRVYSFPFFFVLCLA